jgi:hypothetical protein
MHQQNTFLLTTLLLLAACATAARDPGSPDRIPEPVPTTASELITAPVVVSPIPADAMLAGTDTAARGEVRSSPGHQGQPQSQAPASGRRRWRDGGAMLQGYLGATIYDVERTEGGVTVTADDVEIPSIGGGGQWKLGGERIDFGLEGLLGFNWRSGSTAFATGGGGAVVAVDVDMFLFDLYGGPFASMFLGDAARVYVGGGPLMQWVFYDEGPNGDDSGFGLGYYVRTGLEFGLGGGSLLGAGVRWSDSSVDLGGSLGDVDVDGFLWMITYSYFY